MIGLLAFAAPAGAAGEGDAYEASKIADLPAPNYAAASVWTGESFLVFGGADPYRTSVIAYDPVANATTVLPDLPWPLFSMTAVWDHDKAYIIGGQSTTSASGFRREIIEYDPAGEPAWSIAAMLPQPLALAAAVSEGGSIWIFGGRHGVGATDEILRFGLDGDRSVATVGHLPVGRAGLSAASDGRDVYLFGGQNPAYAIDDGSRTVYRFDPLTLAVEPIATLEESISHAGAVVVGRDLLALGGFRGAEVTSSIQRLALDDYTVAISGQLPTGLSSMAAVGDGCAAYTFGGDEVGRASTNILRIAAASGAPNCATAPDAPCATDLAVDPDFRIVVDSTANPPAGAEKLPGSAGGVTCPLDQSHTSDAGPCAVAVEVGPRAAAGWDSSSGEPVHAHRPALRQEGACNEDGPG